MSKKASEVRLELSSGLSLNILAAKRNPAESRSQWRKILSCLNAYAASLCVLAEGFPIAIVGSISRLLESLLSQMGSLQLKRSRSLPTHRFRPSLTPILGPDRDGAESPR